MTFLIDPARLLGACLASLSLAAFAAPAAPAAPAASAATDTFVPDGARRCVVVSGMSVPIADAKAQAATTAMNEAITTALANDLLDRHYEASAVFVAPGEVEPSPPKSVDLLLRSRCARILQFDYRADADAAAGASAGTPGRFAAWTVNVVRLKRKAGPAGREDLTVVGDYEKRYRLARDAKFPQDFAAGDFARRVVDDLAAAQALPGLHEKGRLTDDDLHARYEALVMAEGPYEFHVRQMQLRTQEEARATLERVRQGERFDVVARAVSQDPLTRDKGGDMGWLVGSALPAELLRVIVPLAPKGLAPGLLHTSAGWHVVELTEVREHRPAPFEAVKGRLAAQVAEDDRRRANAASAASAASAVPASASMPR